MSFFRSSPNFTYTDRVWKTKVACCKGVATEALKALTEGQIAVVFFFFSSDQERFIHFLQANNAPYFVIGSVMDDAGLQNKAILIADGFSNWLGHVDFLRESSGTHKLRVLFFGHYPLLKPEEEVLKNIAQHPSDVPILFCLSLEDGVLESFGSERIKPMMDMLGMGEDEFIEHAMVTKAILKAREKLSGKVTNEMKERIESVWFERNIKSL